MKILVTGTRTDEREGDFTQVALESVVIPRETMFCAGGATGVDAEVRKYCEQNGYDFCEFPANWKGRGKSAGPVRNELMYRLFRPDEVWAFPGRESIGTWHMVKHARANNTTTRVYEA